MTCPQDRATDGAVKFCAVILPCFNEADRLRSRDLVRLARHPAIRLVCVDDGSTDATATVLESIRAKAPDSISIIRRAENGGRGAAVRDGMRQALAEGASMVGFLDADLAAPVEEMMRLHAVLATSDAQAVLGARVRRLGARIERTNARRLLGRTFASLASLAIDVPLYDTQCGAKLFHASPELEAALAEPFVAKWTFDVELIARLYHGGPGAPALGRESFIEVPLEQWHDVAGSKLRRRDAVRALIDLALVGLQTRTRRKQAPAREVPRPQSAAA